MQIFSSSLPTLTRKVGLTAWSEAQGVSRRAGLIASPFFLLPHLFRLSVSKVHNGKAFAIQV